MILVLATQRPDKDSLPTGISANVTIRFCLRVVGQLENDMILGTSAYKNGIRATDFQPKMDAGIGYLVGATPMPKVVRTAYLDTPATQRIADRAHALRASTGALSGHALGETPEQHAPTFDLLADILRRGPAVRGQGLERGGRGSPRRAAARHLRPVGAPGGRREDGPAHDRAQAVRHQDHAGLGHARERRQGREPHRRSPRRHHHRHHTP